MDKWQTVGIEEETAKERRSTYDRQAGEAGESFRSTEDVECGSSRESLSSGHLRKRIAQALHNFLAGPWLHTGVWSEATGSRAAETPITLAWHTRTKLFVFVFEIGIVTVRLFGQVELLNLSSISKPSNHFANLCSIGQS